MADNFKGKAVVIADSVARRVLFATGQSDNVDIDEIPFCATVRAGQPEE